jgi:hypothetical protein
VIGREIAKICAVSHTFVDNLREANIEQLATVASCSAEKPTKTHKSTYT